MSNCRCEDIRKMKKDINTLSEISGRASIMAECDATVVSDLEYLGKASSAAFFSQAGFAYKISHQNGTSTKDIQDLRDRISTLSEQLENDLDAAKKEDDDYHLNQVLSFFHLN